MSIAAFHVSDIGKANGFGKRIAEIGHGLPMHQKTGASMRPSTEAKAEKMFCFLLSAQSASRLSLCTAQKTKPLFGL